MSHDFLRVGDDALLRLRPHCQIGKTVVAACALFNPVSKLRISDSVRRCAPTMAPSMRMKSMICTRVRGLKI
jgi:hypothetical protein